MSPYEHALELARDAEPPALDGARLDAMVATALVARRVPVEAPSPPRRMPWIALAAVAAAAGLFVVARPSSDVGRPETARRETALHEPAPSMVELADGDRLATTTAGTEYTPQQGCRLTASSMFAAARCSSTSPPRDGRDLRTPFGEVRVVGTVFSVRVDDDHAVVRVFEGRVVVQSETESVILGAGGSVSVSTDGFGRAPSPTPGERALEPAASAAVDRRASAPPPVPRVELAEPPLEVVAPVIEDDVAAPADAPAPPRVGRVPRPAFVRLWIADGQPARALAAARRAIDEGQHEATWRMVEADALRRMNDPGGAVVAYERAASLYGPALAARAALSAAELRLDALDDPLGARRTLDRYASSAEPLVATRIDALRERIDAARP
ncbi:MAG: hypothetical protein R3B82_05865 [Sandaracinaceae bacterium]